MREFVDTYLNLNLKDYRNIAIDLEITKLLGLLFIGIMVAAVLMNLFKQKSSLIIKSLLRYECTDEDKAKTLGELHISSRIAEHIAFSDTGRLKRIIKRVGEVEYSYDEYVKMQKEKKKPEKQDRKATKLYIPKERLDEAKRIFEKGAPTLLDTVLICVLLVALYICFVFLMPLVISFINSIL
jgi:hypothetical protein